MPSNQTKKLLTLPIADLSLAPEGQVVNSFNLVEGLCKKVEPVGNGYAKLQGKFMRDAQREQIKKGNTTDAKGKKIVVDDSDDEINSSPEKDGEQKDQEADHREDYEKKRKRKTKTEIEKEALLMENLYEILCLEHKQFEASEVEVKKAYRKASLKYHPDKLGENITESDK